ncbi:MAG TPA: cytochrome c3 family protein [Sphingobacteriaceae bacterium]|nr:cytochrome c3 family protein [Sphingobacteriaceae bacterium]
MRSISLFFRSVAQSILLISSLVFVSISSVQAQDAGAGAAIFKQKCTSCHQLDRKSIGPALSGVTERHDEAWLVKWIKNSQSMVAAGDPAAVKIYNEFNKVAMPAFPELAESDIKNILAYIQAPPAKPEAAAGANGTGEGGSDGGISNFMLIGLIAVVVIAFLVIIVLNRVINALERIILQKQGVVIEEEAEKPGALDNLKRLSRNKKFVFFVVLLTVIFLGSWAWNVGWNTGVHQGYQPVQPIKFSHQLHAGTNQINCQYCHSGAFKSKNASIPSLNVCMNCHNYVQATDKYNGEISPEIMKIYKALDYNPDTRQYGANQKPVEWIRIHNLPDFAYFNHSQHVNVAGIECQKCHGPIQTMEEVYQYSPLTMKWCINCHRETEVDHKGNAYYDKLMAEHDKLKKGGKVTAAVLGGLECGKCHY